MLPRKLACSLLLALLAAAAPLDAWQSAAVSAMSGRTGAGFSLDEILSIQGFFREKGAANRPVMESMDRQISPAARQTLKVGATLHGELRRTALPLPSALESSLPPPPAGMRRRCAGLNILLLDRADRVSDLLKISFDSAKTAAPKATKK